MMVEAFTIGFTKTSASHFFGRLSEARVIKVIDVRLNNTSQLSGFAKAADLDYFLRELCDISYQHEPMLAPNDQLLRAIQKENCGWNIYRENFLSLMAERRVEEQFDFAHFRGACLLCAEASPEHCHRRLVLEYLNQRWHGVLNVRHL